MQKICIFVFGIIGGALLATSWWAAAFFGSKVTIEAYDDELLPLWAIAGLITAILVFVIAGCTHDAWDD